MSSWRIKSVLVALGVCWLAGSASALAPKHVQGLGEDCGPRPDGRKCEKVDCPTRQEKCRPTAVVCDEDGCRITECDCQRPGQCRIHLPDSDDVDIDDVHCKGSCMRGDDCREIRTLLDGGGVRIECRCVPELECEPDSTGLRCNDADCPGNDRDCTPTKVTCGPNGCRVVECDCEHEDRCHPEVTATGAVCVGDCPPGQECREVRTPVPGGGFSLECDCAPIPQCEPDSTGFGCNNVTCPNSTLSCRPTRVFCPATGPCRVVDCDCVGNRCHVEITAAAGAVCVGECPAGTECVRRVQPVGSGSIISCECEEVEEECEPNSTGTGCNDVDCPENNRECRPTRVLCSPSGQCRVIECDCARDRCHVELTAAGPTCVGDCPDDDEVCVRRVETTPNGILVRCDCEEEEEEDCEPNSTGTGCNDVECDDDDEECIPERVICTANGCRVLSCECGDPDRCHVELTTGVLGAICVSECPDGEECVRRAQTTPSGTIIRCECEEVEEECEPNPTGTGCSDVECPDDDEECRPIAVFCPSTGPCRVTNCDCMGDGCHLEITASAGAVCVGECPTGTECVRREVVAVNGFFVRCECEPVQCQLDPVTNQCTGTCPDGEPCRRSEVDGDVTCGCESADCDRGPDAAGNLVCTGFCPTGEQCREVVQLDDNGVPFLDCDCEPGPTCAPNPAGTGCNLEPCPGASFPCIPTLAFCPTGGTCRVVDCDCRMPTPCHVDVNTAGVAACFGPCLEGGVCSERRVNGDGGQFISCECRPPTTTCDALPGGEGCTVQNCPDTGLTCVPITVECEPDLNDPEVFICKVTDCDCREGCRVVPNPDGPIPAACRDACTAPNTCTTVESNIGDVVVVECVCGAP